MVFEFKDFRFEQDGRLINVFDPEGKQIVFNADQRTGIINRPIFDSIEESKRREALLDTEKNPNIKDTKQNNTNQILTILGLGIIGGLIFG